eukprot:scaffold3516_cov26-Phaeocystis_antarctica.AAC.2
MAATRCPRRLPPHAGWPAQVAWPAPRCWGLFTWYRCLPRCVNLAHVDLEGLARLHDDAAARHAVNDDLERRIEAHVLDQLGARGLLLRGVP